MVMVKMSRKWREVKTTPTTQGRMVARSGLRVDQRKIRCWESEEATTWCRVKAIAEIRNSETVVERLGKGR